MNETRVDYFRDPQIGGIVYGSDGNPLFTTRMLSTEQHADYRDLPAWCRPETIHQQPAARSGAALASGEVLLCNRCHLPRREPRSGRLRVMIEQHELVFVPERYCECEGR
jgi:hypothetical protein